MVLSLRCGVIFGFFIETEKTYVESAKLYKSFDMLCANLQSHAQLSYPADHFNDVCLHYYFCSEKQLGLLKDFN